MSDASQSRTRLVLILSGSAPAEKHETLLERIDRNVGHARLFYTTSITSRSGHAFGRSNTVLPPFAYHAFVHALHALSVDTHFVALGEGDGVSVRIANTMGGFILGQDSDFFILISTPGANRTRGYCPFDQFQWIEGADPSMTKVDDLPAKGSREWYMAAPKYNPQPQIRSVFYPPKSLVAPTLVLTYIAPSALPKRLMLPSTHLPLLGSLVGNDYTPDSYRTDLFERGFSSTQNIERTARIIREQAYGPSSKASPAASAPATSKSEQASDAGDKAIELIRKVVNKLSVVGVITDGVMQEMVEKIVGSTFQYILPDNIQCCDVYPFCGQYLDRGCQSGGVTPQQIRYAETRRKGWAMYATGAYLHPDRVYLYTVLEDPSNSSHRTSPILQEVRRQAWFTLEQSLGELRWPGQSEEELGMATEDTQPKELLKNGHPEVSVDELGDRVAKLSTNGNSDHNVDVAQLSQSFRPRVMVEYSRRGTSQRCSAVSVALPPASEQSVKCTSSLQDRIQRYCSVLHSDTTTVRALSPSLHPLVACVRMCIIDAGRHEVDSLKWRKTEVIAVLKAGLGMLIGWDKECKVSKTKKKSDNFDKDFYPPLVNRNCNLVAQVNAVSLDSLLLAEALGLTPLDNDQLPKTAGVTLDLGLTHIFPFMYISGVTLHHLLSNLEPPVTTGWKWNENESDQLLDTCYTAVIDGLENSILGLHTAPTLVAKSNKYIPPNARDRGAYPTHQRNSSQSSGPKAKSQPRKPLGRFDLLQELAS